MNSFYFVIFFFLFVSPASAYNSTLYDETEQFIIDQTFAFNDGIFLMNLLKPINETCVEPKFKFRVLHLNGSLDTFDFNPQIPEHNFCYGPSGNYLFFIEKSALPEFLYVLYVNSTDIQSASYYIQIVTRKGDLISNSYISPATIVKGIIYEARIEAYSSDEYGFVFSKFHQTKPLVMWSCFSAPDDKGKIDLLGSGNINLQNPLDEYNMFPAISGKYGFLTFFSSSATEMTPGPAFTVFLTFVGPTKKGVTGILYSSSIPQLVNKYDISIKCNGDHYGKTVNSCIFIFRNIRFNNKYFFMEILFKDNGSNVNYNNNKLKINLNENVAGELALIDLYNGGYLLFSCIGSKKKVYEFFNGTILDNNKNYHSNLDFPLSLNASKTCQLLFSNSGNAFLIIQNNERSWKILSTNLPKFVIDVGYGNPVVNFTNPSINSYISFPITNINITYNFPISTSNNNILIYQYNDGTLPLIRQIISGKTPSFFSSNSDNKTISIKVLNSTFNQPNSKYFVVVEDDAFVELSTGQPLLGIPKNRWNFSTTGQTYKFAGEVFGSFYLTVDGTNYFINLSPDKKREFFVLLKIQLSYAIPVDINRLSNIKYNNYKENQLLLSLIIRSTRNKNEKNVKSIIEDLNLLIQQKEITSISQYNITKFLDEKYGFQIDESILGKYKVHIITGSIGLTSLISTYFYAKKRYPAGKNIAIFLFASMTMDFVFDLLFIVNHGKDLSELFIPSVIFFILSMLVNLALTMILIIFEILEDQAFYTWFRNNTNIGILFIILASVDIKILNVLSSQVAGIMTFNVNLSERAQSIIFWGNFVAIFIEDIPQFVIQVYYKQNTVIYDPTPLITLALG